MLRVHKKNFDYFLIFIHSFIHSNFVPLPTMKTQHIFLSLRLLWMKCLLLLDSTRRRQCKVKPPHQWRLSHSHHTEALTRQNCMQLRCVFCLIFYNRSTHHHFSISKKIMMASMSFNCTSIHMYMKIDMYAYTLVMCTYLSYQQIKLAL